MSVPDPHAANDTNENSMVSVNTAALRRAAHDVKNELASILALTEMTEILAKNADSTIKTNLEKMRKRTLQASNIVTKVFQELAESDSRRE